MKRHPNTKSIILNPPTKRRLMGTRAFKLGALTITRYGDGSTLIENQARAMLVLDASGTQQLIKACQVRQHTRSLDWPETIITPHPSRLNQHVGLIVPLKFSAPYRVAGRWRVALGQLELGLRQMRQLCVCFSH